MTKSRLPNTSCADGPQDCTTCNSTIGSAEYSIMCALCDASFHHRCIDFSDSNYNAFSKLLNAGLVSYYCPACKDAISRLPDKQPADVPAPADSDVALRLAKVEEQLGNIGNALDVLTGKASPDEAAPPASQNETRLSYAQAAATGITSSARVVTVSDLHRVKEDEGHRRSIVVAGLPETGRDFEAVAALVKYLDPSACVSDVFRMGRVPKNDAGGPGRPRLLKAHLPSSSVVKSLLGEASKLKHSSDFKGVYIRRSMTKEERQELSNLRTACKGLNDDESAEGVKYVLMGHKIVRFNDCTKEGDRLVGGTRDRSWSPSQGLNYLGEQMLLKVKTRSSVA